MTSIFDRLVAILAPSNVEKGNSHTPKDLRPQKRGRTCRIEELEAREMLSAIAIGADTVDINSDLGPTGLFSAAEIMPLAALGAPVINSFDVVNSTTLSVSWTGDGGDSGYRVEVATDPDFTQFVRNQPLGGGVDRWEISNLTPGTLYYVRVWAITHRPNPDDPDGDPIIDEFLSDTQRQKTPSTVVTSLDDYVGDNGYSLAHNSISLREAIYYAGQYGLGTTITFASSLNDQTITASDRGAVGIDKDITINGTGSNISISGNFFIDSGASVVMQGLRITGADNGIDNSGSLTVTNCTITGNSGAGINNSGGTLTVSGGMITANSGDGIRGSGGIVGVTGTEIRDNGGFGINCTGDSTLTITNCPITGNNGGGINNSGGTLTVSGGTITANSGDGIRGSGGIVGVTGTEIRDNGGFGINRTGDSTLTVTNCPITGNNSGGINSSGGTLTVSGGTITGNSGDGIHGNGVIVEVTGTEIRGNNGFGMNCTGDSTLTVTRCPVSENQSGGISNDGILTVLNSTISDNGYIAMEDDYTITGIHGGIYCSGSSAIITDCTITRNRTSGGGGGIYNSCISTIISNCTITENTTSDSGGGICNSGGGAATVENSTVTENSAANGGGVYNSGIDSQITVTNVTIAENTASNSGGGIYNSGGGIATVENSAITDNSAVNGGGIYNTGIDSQITVTNSPITENTASGSGGGIYNGGSGTATVDESAIADNSAVNGGGIYNTGIDSQITVTNSPITENTASNSGGGIYNGGSGTVTVEDIRIAGNSAIDGGGIYSTGDGTQVAAANCTITENMASNSGGGIYNTGTKIDVMDCTITNNNNTMGGPTQIGGGIYNNIGTLTVSRGVIAGHSTSSHGAGIYNDTAGTLIINTNCRISGNSTSGDGGGVYNIGMVTVENSEITDNSAAHGGGIYNGGSRTATVSGSTVTNNRATDGGGIYNTCPLINIMYCTISENGASGSGGGIYSIGSETNVTNCTIANNINLPTRTGGGIYHNTGTLTVTGGTISGHRTNSHGAGIFNDTTGTLIINADCRISGNSSFGDGGGVYNIGIQTTVSDSTITGNSAAYNGGGIFSSTILTVENYSTISNNSATYSGGGIYNNTGGTLSVNLYSTISGNSAIRNGGGVYNDISSTLTLSNYSMIVGNSASSHGGGIYNSTNGLLTLSNNSMILGNSATSYGGGIYNISTRNNTVSNCTISANSAIRNGGGVYNWGTLTVSSSTVTRNVSNNRGGGFSNVGTLTLSNCTLSENEACNRGGAICNGNSTGGTTVDDTGTVYPNPGILTVTGCIITGNLGVDMGGGIHSEHHFSHAEITNCMIAGNSGDCGGGINLSQGTMNITSCTIVGNAGFELASDRGGGIRVYEGDLTINNTIVAQNSNAINGDIDYGAYAVISGSNNLIGDGSVLYHLGDDVENDVIASISFLLHEGNENIIGTAEFPVDPMFVAFTPYELWTKDQWRSWNLRLAADSPAIDIGAGMYSYDPSPFLLNTPTLDSVTAIGDNAISVKWSAVPGANGYAIIYATDPNFTEGAGTVFVNSLSTTIPRLSTGMTYYVRVMAVMLDVDSFHTSDYSETKSVTVGKIKLSEPALGGIIPMGTNSIRISWNGASSAMGYVIEYATDAKFTENVGSVKTSATSHTITGLYSDSHYYVRVKAIGTGDYCDSDYSEAKTALTDRLNLAAPTLDGPVASGASISVAWNVVTDAREYVVEYATDASFTTGGGRVDTTDTSVIISELKDNTLYYVRVFATDIGGRSPSNYSATMSVTTEKVYLTAPTLDDLVVTGNSLTVSWGDVEDASGYVVEYATDPEFDAVIGTANTTATSTTITGLRTDTLYYVRVMATDTEYENSPYSTEKSVTTLPTPDLGTAVPVKPVIKVDKKSTTVGSVTFTWTISTKNTDYIAENYVITCVSHPEIQVTPDMITITGKKAVMTIGNLDHKTKYKFSIVATNGEQEANPVSISATTAKYTAVRSLKSVLAAKTSESVTLTWKPPAAKADTDGYVVEVYDATGKVSLGIVVTITDVNTTTITISGLKAKMKYTFEVKATAGKLTSVAAKVKVTTLKM